MLVKKKKNLGGKKEGKHVPHDLARGMMEHVVVEQVTKNNVLIRRNKPFSSVQFSHWTRHAIKQNIINVLQRITYTLSHVSYIRKDTASF